MPLEAPAGSTLPALPTTRCTSSRAAAGVVPGGNHGSSSRNSMRSTRSGRPNHSWAVAMSVSRTSSSPAPTVSFEEASSTPMQWARTGEPPMRSGSTLPGTAPSRFSVAGVATKAPGRVSQRSSASGAPDPNHVRSPRSASGSQPSTRTTRLGPSPRVRAMPPTEGAQARRPWTARSWPTNAASRPAGPPWTVWVAAPATASTERSKADSAELRESRNPVQSAQPSAMPMRVRNACSRWRRWCRSPMRKALRPALIARPRTACLPRDGAPVGSAPRWRHRGSRRGRHTRSRCARARAGP